MAIGHIRKGAFHRWLGKSTSAPITSADIAKGLKAGGHAAKMAAFAKAARKFHHSAPKAAHKPLYPASEHKPHTFTHPKEDRARKVWSAHK